MSDKKIYEVYIPVQGRMKIYLQAEDRIEAIQKATMIASNMRDDSGDAIIPNLHTWWVDIENIIKFKDGIVAIEKGESDE